MWLSLSNTTKSLLAMRSSSVRDAPRMTGPTQAARAAPNSIRRHRRFGAQRRANFLFGRPPARTFDLGDAVTDDRGRRLHLVEPTGVGAEELGLVLLRQPVLLHRLDRPPGVVAIVVIDVGRPAQDVAVELGQPRRRRLVAFEAGHAM